MVSSPLAGEGRGEGSVSYAYDGDGNRVSKTDSSGTIKYINDIALPLVQVLQETDSAGNLLASYIYGNDLICQTRAGISSYYLYDGLGSTRQLTDSSGAITDSYIYEGFGNCVYSSGTTVNPYLFTGEQQNLTTGLVYLRARYYDPSIGRFISRDPILSPRVKPEGQFWFTLLLANQPQRLHPYLYCMNNPINYIDPSGLRTLEECGNEYRACLAECGRTRRWNIPGWIRCVWRCIMDLYGCAADVCREAMEEGR